MKKFKILAIEHYSSRHVVEGNSLEDAIQKLRNKYQNEEISINGNNSNFSGIDFIEDFDSNCYLKCNCELKPLI